MFTGIIEATAEILSFTDGVLTVRRPAQFTDVRHGCSIAVSGACLSVTSFDDATLSFDVVPTTIRKTKLGTLKAGDSVNLERALPATGRFEGHVVTGHIEAVATVDAVTEEGLTILVPEDLLPYVVEHGSVTLDGVALTVASLSGNRLTVALIPITRKETTFGTVAKGDTVNLETDLIGKYILRAHGA